jgi:hypothetical protein
MADERSTSSKSDLGTYRPADRMVRSAPSTRTSTSYDEGRIVSTSRSVGSVTVRVTTRSAPVRKSTE